MRASPWMTLLLCAALSPSAVWAQGPVVDAIPAAEAESGVEAEPATAADSRLTETDATAWLDGFMPYALARGDVAGAVVTVVKDGQLLVQRGYGHADVTARKPVDPALTLFRPGSVSKLVTWTAVMQLVEQGKLDLDTDINTYLDFKVPAKGESITLRHVLTHTTGLEERVKHLMNVDPAGPQPLGDYLKSWVPGQMFKPGTTPAYSNYATSLAGYIVERVSGQSFDDYVDAHIFAPLGMRHSSFRQPLPAELQPLMSQGYALGSGEAKPYEMVTSAPAGSLASSGADMARFMLAHLQTAAGQSSPILSAQTAALMYERQTMFTPPLNTMALGFYETNINGRRVIAHGGDTQWFHSYLHLFVEEGVGLFVSVNSAGKDGVTGVIRSELFTQFANRYFPADAEPAQPGVDAETAAAHAHLLASHKYENTRRSDSGSYIKLMGLSQLSVVINDDGTISAPGINAPGGQPIRWREVAPYVWQDVNGSEQLAAVVDADGKLQHWSVSAFSGFMQFEPVPGYRSGAWLMPLLIVSLASLALAFVAWPVGVLVRRRYRQPLAWAKSELRVRRLARVAAGSIVAVWLCWMGLFSYVMADFSRFTEDLDKWIVLLSVLGLLAALAGIALLAWHAWLSWTRRKDGWLHRIFNVWLVVAALVSTYAAFLYGLLSMATDY